MCNCGMNQHFSGNDNSSISLHLKNIYKLLILLGSMPNKHVPSSLEKVICWLGISAAPQRSVICDVML